MSANIQIFPEDEWAQRCALMLDKQLNRILDKKGECSIMLTGGHSAAKLYNAWRPLIQNNTGRISFYFGDERCVSVDDAESNAGMAKQTLLKDTSFDMYPMYSGSKDPQDDVESYEKLVPASIDIVLLSIGEDGHIASLFPGSELLHEGNKRVALVRGPKPPNPRITITPRVLTDAANIFCLAIGASKKKALSLVFQEVDVREIPARLVAHANWLVDDAAAETI